MINIHERRWGEFLCFEECIFTTSCVTTWFNFYWRLWDLRHKICGLGALRLALLVLLLASEVKTNEESASLKRAVLDGMLLILFSSVTDKLYFVVCLT